MLFPSVVFLFYFLPAVLIGYLLLSFSRRLQNVFLLLASLFFYAWGEPKNIYLLLFIIVINYILALMIQTYRKQKWGRYLLTAGILLDIGILFLYKYAGFLLDNIAVFLTVPHIVLELPLGISFFVLQAVSYLVDIYREEDKALRNPLDAGLYIAFFPQLIAGPIVRYHTIARQIRKRRTTWRTLSLGTCRFLTGMIKKVLLANLMAVAVDLIYGWSSTGSISVLLAWLGAGMYLLQIYYDFSGYSDMAIGLGLMFGFVFEENFNYPYTSKSISEFWRRWHISLGAWIRDYIYIPLGGSRVKNSDRMVRNLFIVWLATGLWHGANWTFIFWGIYNFIFIFLEKLIRLESREMKHPGLWHAYTILVVCIGMVLFRSSDLLQAGEYLSSMLHLSSNVWWDTRFFMLLKEYGIFIFVGIVFCVPTTRRFQKVLLDKANLFTRFLDGLYPLVLILLFWVSVIYIVKGSYNPFIYFNF